MLGVPKPVDPEVAAATFAAHLSEVWGNRLPSQSAWELTVLDDLNAVVRLPAKRATGEEDHYYVKLGAQFYDAWPPMASFVVPESDGGWPEAAPSTRWFPNITGTQEFGLHGSYPYLDGINRPLLCFTFAAQYYQTSHSPAETTVWRQGRHTLAATLTRIAEMLQPTHYLGPSGDK